MSRFAQNLKALRLERGLTQAALARRAGLASTAISMYELGQRQPDLDRLERLAQALDAPASALLACCLLYTSRGIRLPKGSTKPPRVLTTAEQSKLEQAIKGTGDMEYLLCLYTGLSLIHI